MTTITENSGPIITTKSAPKRRWRFADFRATGRWVDDIGVELQDGCLMGMGGRLYGGRCWISYDPAGEPGQRWATLIGRTDWIGTLLRMEKMLFLWAAIECRPDDCDPLRVIRSLKIDKF